MVYIVGRIGFGDKFCYFLCCQVYFSVNSFYFLRTEILNAGHEIELPAGTEKEKLKRKEREIMIAEAEKGTVDMIETVTENEITLGATRGKAVRLIV